MVCMQTTHKSTRTAIFKRIRSPCTAIVSLKPWKFPGTHVVGNPLESSPYNHTGPGTNGNAAPRNVVRRQRP
jgi:hypothetical protein